MAHIMDPATTPSPSSTQRADLESPVKEYRRNLERLGMPPAKIDYLLRTYNQRLSCFDDDAEFLNIVEELVTTQGCTQVTDDDFRIIETGLQNRNKELEAQFKAFQTTVLLDPLAYLSTEKYEHVGQYALDFIQSDSYNCRLNFIIKVLPLLLNNAPASTHQHAASGTVQVPEEPKKRTRKTKAQTSVITPRRSARINERLQKDSKKPSVPPLNRHKKKKGGRVRRRS